MIGLLTTTAVVALGAAAVLGALAAWLRERTAGPQGRVGRGRGRGPEVSVLAVTWALVGLMAAVALVLLVAL